MKVKWKQILESVDQALGEMQSLSSDRTMENDVIDAPALDNMTDDKDVLEELNQIFTPILVMQGFEGDLSDQIQEAFSEASVLMEKNIIKFDDETRLAQLIATCALLLQKKKNTEKWQMYKKAATIRNQMKLDMQKEEYNAAKVLAQKYLVHVLSTNNSSIARQAANELLPITN